MSRLLLWYHESEWSNQAPKKGVTTVLNNQIIWQCKDTISFTLVHKKTCLFKNWILHVKTICVAACLNVLNWKQTWMSFWAIAKENMYSTKKKKIHFHLLSADLSPMRWVADRRGQDPQRPICNSQMFGQPVSYRGSDAESLLKYRSNQ